MNEPEKDSVVSEEQKPEPQLSPSDKLDRKPDESLIPGAQNPDSPAIKNEVNPNTE